MHVLLCAYVTLPLSCRRPERDRPGPKDRYPVGVRVFSQIRKRRRFSGGLKKQPSRTACYAVFCFFFLFSKIIVRITYGIRSRWPRGRRGGDEAIKSVESFFGGSFRAANNFLFFYFVVYSDAHTTIVIRTLRAPPVEYPVNVCWTVAF